MTAVMPRGALPPLTRAPLAPTGVRRASQPAHSALVRQVRLHLRRQRLHDQPPEPPVAPTPPPPSPDAEPEVRDPPSPGQQPPVSDPPKSFTLA